MWLTPSSATTILSATSRYLWCFMASEAPELAQLAETRVRTALRIPNPSNAKRRAAESLAAAFHCSGWTPRMVPKHRQNVQHPWPPDHTAPPPIVGHDWQPLVDCNALARPAPSPLPPDIFPGILPQASSPRHLLPGTFSRALPPGHSTFRALHSMSNPPLGH